MGNKFSRRRDAPASGGETAVAEKKTEEPAPSQQTDESETTQTPETINTEEPEVVVGKVMTPVASLPNEPCILECKVEDAPAASATVNDVEPKETPPPVQPELLVSNTESSPPESEPVIEPQPAAEAQLSPEPAQEPAPELVSELVPEPEPSSNLEAEVEATSEPIAESAPVPVEALEQQTDMLIQESVPEPETSSTPLIDLGALDITPEPVNTPPAPAPIPDPVNADEASDNPVKEECQDSVEAEGSSAFELEKSEETSESLEKPVEVEATENWEQFVSDVNEESISGLMQNLELKGNDLVADLIPDDVKIPDDAPITDISTSTELM